MKSYVPSVPKTTEAKQPLVLRARPSTVSDLRRRARETGQSQSSLAERYIEEGIRTDEHPLVTFRNGTMGRRPALAGTRLVLWQVISTVHASENSLEETASYLELPKSHVRAAVHYYADYRAEIDDWIQRASAIADREERRFRSEQSLLR